MTLIFFPVKAESAVSTIVREKRQKGDIPLTYLTLKLWTFVIFCKSILIFQILIDQRNVSFLSPFFHSCKKHTLSFHWKKNQGHIFFRSNFSLITMDIVITAIPMDFQRVWFLLIFNDSLAFFHRYFHFYASYDPSFLAVVFCDVRRMYLISLTYVKSDFRRIWSSFNWKD